MPPYSKALILGTFFGILICFCGFYFIHVWWYLISGFEFVGLLVFLYIGLRLWFVSWLSEPLICGFESLKFIGLKPIALHRTEGDKSHRCKSEIELRWHATVLSLEKLTHQFDENFCTKTNPIQPCTPLKPTLQRVFINVFSKTNKHFSKKKKNVKLNFFKINKILPFYLTFSK